MKEKFDKLKFDKLIKDKLEGYQPKPPEEIWLNVKAEIPKYKMSPIKNFYVNHPVISGFLSALLVLTCIMGFYVVVDSFFKIQSESQDKNDLQNNILISKNLKLEDNSNSNELISLNADNNKNIHNNKIVEKSLFNKNTSFTQNIKNNIFDDKTTFEKYLQQKDNCGNEDKFDYLKLDRMLIINKLSSLILAPESLEYKHIVTQQFLKKEFDYKRPNWRYLGGVYFSLENNYNVHQNPLIKEIVRTQHIDFNFTTLNKILLLQSGLGFFMMKDEVDHIFKYKTLDSVGYYYDVDSLTFNEFYDPITGQVTIVPVYHYKPVTIFDSVMHTDVKTGINRYLYLRMPVILGIHKEFRKFDIYVKGGFLWNFVIYSKKQSFEYQMNNPTLVKTEDLSKERTKGFGQFVVNCGVNLYLSSRLSACIEPTYTYYVGKVYYNVHSAHSKAPYSVGIKIGFNYEF